MKKLIILTLLLVSFLAHAGYTTKNQKTVTATTTSTKVLEAEGGRSYLMIVNNGANAVLVKLDSVHTGSEGISIPAGGYYEPFVSPSGSVWLKTSASSSSIYILEGVSQ